MVKLYLYFETIRHLKLKQLYFRFSRRVIKPKVSEIFTRTALYRPAQWQSERLHKRKIGNDLDAVFLNFHKRLEFPADWNEETPNKLWVYNLQYFEDLNTNGITTNPEFYFKLLKLWIKQNPVGVGNGWEPYPSSLRIVNILKAWLSGFDLDCEIEKSVFEQASFLSNNLEKHLLGNHYFVNLKALLFSGLIFNMPRWISIAEKGLLVEIPEQILDDGANFELSPMYHSLILVDMLDMFNLCRSYSTVAPKELHALIKKTIPSMLSFMRVISHPDGEVSFFNDAAIGIAPNKNLIDGYAKNLGFSIKKPKTVEKSFTDNKNSGYICAEIGSAKLIFDASAVGPDYIPGHAHADTLSFEMSIGMQRIFVNTGTSEYGLTQKRMDQRKTKAHNTVEIDEKDSSQVWSSFRVGKRAKIISRSVVNDVGNEVFLVASHSGYNPCLVGVFTHVKSDLKKMNCM